MANVRDAMKKFEAEQAGKAGPAPVVPAASPTGVSRAGLPGCTGNGPPAAVKFAPDLVVHHDRGSAAADEYRALRDRLFALYDTGRFCLLVTSAEADEWKTVVCLNLALALAEGKDRRVAVVDVDLRGGGMAALLGIEKRPGVADVLRGEAMLQDALRPTPEPNLTALPAGETPPETVADLLAGPALDAMVASLRQKFDCVLLSAPAVGLFPDDTAAIARAAGDALVVVRMHKTRRDAVDLALRILRSWGAMPAGLVLAGR